MAKLNVVFGAVTNPLRRGFGKVKAMVGGLTAMLAGGLAAGLGMVTLALKEVVMAGAKFEMLNVQFEVLLGSAEKAAETIKQLRGFADVTPFDTNSVVEASRALIATGSAGQLLQHELQMAGDIAAGTGKRLQDIVNIYAKVKRQGRLTFEEINQLANSGALTMEELYKKTGKSKVAFRSFVEAGRADFSIIKELFEESTAEGGRFNGMMEKLSKTLGGRWSTLLGKTQNLFADLGKDTTSPMVRVVDAMIRGVEALSKMEVLFRSIANSAEATADAVELFSGIKSPSEIVGRKISTAMPGGENVQKVIESVGKPLFEEMASKGFQRFIAGFVPGQTGGNLINQINKGQPSQFSGSDAQTQKMLNLAEQQTQSLKQIADQGSRQLTPGGR